MAVSAEKVKVRIRAMFPKTNLTTKRLDEISAKLGAKIEDNADEAAIDAAVTDFNENSILTIEEIAKNDDRIASLTKKAVEPPKPKTEPKSEEDKKDEDPLSLVLSELKATRAEIANLKAENQQKSIEERFKADERLKNVPAAMLKGRIPKDEDSFEDSVTELVSDWQEISGHTKTEATKAKIGAFRETKPVAGGGGAAGETQQASQEEADAIAKQLV